ncbi:MAG: hypothetical protein Q4F17_09770 [Eubacteriales bacterium]|nr:hypothetical protein [Eubacteriales bacterium]
MKKNVFAVIALAAALVLVLCGCGKKDTDTPPEKLPESGELGLNSVELSAYAWSSNNGATVSVKAQPAYYAEGMKAQLVVRLEGEEVENEECTWDNGYFYAEADLNADDGLCYYLILTAPDGETAELEVNTPNNPGDEDLINLAHALEAYCHMDVSDFTYSGSKLTVHSGLAQIQLPQIAQDGGSVACDKAELVLLYNEQEVARVKLPLTEDISQVAVSDVVFDVPAMQDDEQLMLNLEVTLTDGQLLTAPACTWFYNDGQLLPAVG